MQDDKGCTDNMAMEARRNFFYGAKQPLLFQHKLIESSEIIGPNFHTYLEN